MDDDLILELVDDNDEEPLEIVDGNDDQLELSHDQPVVNRDYEKLVNRPQINGVELVGNKSASELSLLSQNMHSTSYWDSHGDYVPDEGEIIIYTDRSYINGTYYAGIKIGDGLAYVADLPFVGDDAAERIKELLQTALTRHIQDKVLHITNEERAFWNGKLNYSVDEEGETLILNRM